MKWAKAKLGRLSGERGGRCRKFTVEASQKVFFGVGCGILWGLKKDDLPSWSTMDVYEVSEEIPPAFTLDPARAVERIEARVGELVTIDVTLFNTGCPAVGLAVYLTGEAINGDFVAPGMASAEWAELEQPIEAPFGHRRMQGEFVLEAHIWDIPYEGAPPMNYVPAGLTIPPPYFFRDPEENEAACDHWDERMVEMVLGITALKAGQSTLEVWIVPPENPQEGVLWSIVLEVFP